MSRVIKKIMDIFMIIVIIFLAVYICLRITGYIAVYKVETGSMEDTIHIGDYIISKKMKSYELDDIVTYKRNGDFITHRIVEINGDKVITKGDANNTTDEEIDKSIITGKVIVAGGGLNIFMNFKFALVSLLLALYLFTCYFNEQKEK